MMEGIAEGSPRFRARMAGAVYFFSVGVAVYGEMVGGRVGYAAGLMAVLGMAAMTLLVYGIFRPVNGRLCLLAAVSSLAGLALEALRWNPRGVDIAMGFHGIYCVLIGYLILQSDFMPRILGASMALAGLGWLTYLSPPLANHLSPYVEVFGLIGEGLPMLWVLVMGVSGERWKKLAGTAA